MNVDLVEVAAARMNHDTANSAVAHEQIRSATDDEERQIFAPAKTNQFRESFFVPRLDPKLRRPADAQGRVFRERLVKPDVALLARRSPSIFPR